MCIRDSNNNNRRNSDFEKPLQKNLTQKNLYSIRVHKANGIPEKKACALFVPEEESITRTSSTSRSRMIKWLCR